MNARRAAYLLVAMSITALSLTSCGLLPFGDNVMRPTLNQQQSIDRIEWYIHDAIAAMAPLRPSLEFFKNTSVPCDVLEDAGPQGHRVSLAHGYFLRDLPPGFNTAPLFDQMLAYWKSHGFSVLRDERPTTQSIMMENISDDFAIGLERGADGTISISASSPCIWPTGTPTPKG